MTPDANDLCVFAVKRGYITGRFDVQNLKYNTITHNSKAKVTLGSLTSEEPCYGTSAIAIERTDESQPKYIRITDFDDFGIESSHTFVTADNYAEKHILKEGDILFARTGATVGKSYYYDGSIGKAIFAGYCIRFRFDENKVLPKFAYWCTKTTTFTNWVKGIQRPSGQPNINKEEYKSFEITLPDLNIQGKLCAELDCAEIKRRQKLQQADELLADFENEISQKFNLNISSKNCLCIAIRLKDCDGVIDAKRYMGGKRKSDLTLGDVCDIVEEKENVANYQNEVIDWIRIDDLPNNPLEIEIVRTLSADEMDGTFFKVQKGDILVARLGPTILNRKTVMVRKTERNTLASAEFLVLRCKKGFNAEAVMAVLKTEYYKNLMYSNSRGSTPSRYRLNREDALKLPFPDISALQDDIAHKAVEVSNKSIQLRLEAEQEWAAAKAQFEIELLGE